MKSEENYPEKSNDREEYHFLQENIKRKSFVSLKVKNRGRNIVIGCLLAVLFLCIVSIFFKGHLYKWLDNRNQVKIFLKNLDPLHETDDTESVEASMHNIVSNVKESVVEVSVSGDTDDHDEALDKDKERTDGIIIAENQNEVFVLIADTDMVKRRDFLVNFSDQSSCKARIKGRNKRIGIAVLTIDKADLKSGMSVHIAKLGKVEQMNEGDPIFLIGNVFSGEEVHFGHVYMQTQNRCLADGKYDVIETDLDKDSLGCSLITNNEGYIIGIVSRYGADDGSDVVREIGISDLRGLIENLINLRETSYLGIHIMDPKESLRERKELQDGLYVESVDVDSPAMAAGIQTGDVITDLDEAKNYIQKKKPRDTMDVEVKRWAENEFTKIKFQLTVGKAS